MCICHLSLSAKGAGMAGVVRMQFAAILAEKECEKYSAGFKHFRQYMNFLHWKKPVCTVGILTQVKISSKTFPVLFQNCWELVWEDSRSCSDEISLSGVS